MQKLFALWEYDGQTLLGGPIKEIMDDGRVRVENYGGAIFQPALILPLKRGEVVLVEFQALEKQFEEARAKFHAEWTQKYVNLREKHGVKK
jgi:hypothetical protein